MGMRADCERLICTVLRGEVADWNAGDDAEAIAAFLAAGRYHGVLPLLGASFRREKSFDSWPIEIVSACGDAARMQAVYELAHRAADTRVVDALSSAGMRPLVLKGTGLAYTLYSSPILRPRGDTDVLIPAGMRSGAERVLQSLGYTKSNAAGGDLISYQASWVKSDAFGAEHRVDLHWRSNNSQILAKAADYEGLAARAVSVPALGPGTLTPCPVDALLFACIHRAGHVAAPYFVDDVAHYDIDRLIWLYDIHLLVSALSDTELDEWVALASKKRIKAICRDGLSSAVDSLGTPVPPRVLEGLGPEGASEPSAHYLRGNRARLMIEDFRALDRWSARMAWAKQLAFPPAGYMHAKYPEAGCKWLPVLYARRSFTGFSRLIARQGGGSAR